jgi:twitching motility two-component system response regulator PilH
MPDIRQKKMKAAIRVLLVEDEPALRDIYATKMRIEGLDVIEACDGIDGLDKAVQEMPSIVLLDIVMPMKNGFEVLRDLKANPKTKDIPVVILSNLGQDYEIKQGLALGAECFLTKANLTPAKMLEEVRNVLRRHGLEGG